MKIGDIDISDWKYGHPSGYSPRWYREFRNSRGTGYLYIIPSRRYPFCNVLMPFFLEEYRIFFPDNCFSFDTVDDAKDRVDSFLNKFSKLKAFI
jgi:hypothetical protein